MKGLKFSILIPAYNGEEVIGETIRSILSQSFKDYELLIQDDASIDNTEGALKYFRDKRIKYFENKQNLGYTKNLEKLRKRATGDIIYLMGQDDILAENALLNTYKAFLISDDIGAVTRPYYWFDKNIENPVRAKQQLNPNKDEVIRITDDPSRIIKVFNTLDQLSGLAMRKKYIDIPFHEDIFPCHVSPFASIFKKHPIVFLKDYNIAVRIRTSQSRLVSSIYYKSPIQSWVDMIDKVFYEKQFDNLRQYLIEEFVAVNYVGLIQIRNYSKFKYLLREIFLLLKYRWKNIYNPIFWFYTLGTLLIPPFLLIPLVDWYKSAINSKVISKINFSFKL